MIFVDTNVVSEHFARNPAPQVLAWLKRHDADIALPTITIAEIAYGIHKLPPSERPARLERGLLEWRTRFADRIFGFTEDAALVFGEIAGAARRAGRAMSVQDGMIAAIVRVNDGALATRNTADFQHAGIKLVSPWDY